MITKYFMDSKGNYLGCWIWPENVDAPIGIPNGAIEVASPPLKAWYKWNRIEKRWQTEDEVELLPEEKQALYLEAAPIHEQIEAMQDLINGRPEKWTSLNEKLQEIKKSFNNSKYKDK